MQETFQTVLNWFAANGVWALAGLLFVAGLGIPSPASIGVLAAGALVRTGQMSFLPAVIASVAGSSLGQLGSYWIGRKGLKGAFRKIMERKTWRKAHDRFEKRREPTIFFSRWVLTPLAMPVNLIAGMAKYPWWRFLALTAAGNLIWVLLYGGVGYSVGAAWNRLGDAARWLEIIGTIVGIAIIVALIVRKRMKTKAVLA
ncbi:DedA family protein [soil metagenome]